MFTRALRRGLVWVLGLFGGLALLLVLTLSAGFAWVSVTPSGARWALVQALKQVPGGGQVEDVRGTWLDGLTVGRLTLSEAGVDLADVFIDIDWRQALLGHLAIADLNIREVLIDQTPGRVPVTRQAAPAESVPAKGPAELLRAVPVLPVPVDIRRIQVGQIRILGIDELPEFTSSDMALTLQLGVEQHRLVLERALIQHAQMELALRGRMSVSPQGFPAFRAELDGNLRQEDRRGVLRLDVLASPDAGGQAWLRLDGEGLSLEANGSLALDQPVTLRRFDISWRGLNPADWFSEAPQALLRGRAELLGPTATEPNWRGVVELANDRPGSISESDIPLRSLRSRYVWRDGQRLDFSDLEVLLPRGSVQGQLALIFPAIGPRQPNQRLPRVQGDLQVQGLDLSALNSAWPTTNFDGLVRAETDPEGRDLQAQIEMRSPAAGQIPAARFTASVQANLIERAGAIEIDELRLQNLRVRGLAQARWAEVPFFETTLQVSGLRPEQWTPIMPETVSVLIEGRVRASASLQEALAWSAELDLAPTARLQGQPLLGRVSARGEAADLRDLQVDLTQGEQNRLQARWQGGLLRPELQAELQLDRPEWWLPQLGGRASLSLQANLERAQLALAGELTGWTHWVPLEWSDTPLKGQLELLAERLPSGRAAGVLPWQITVSSLTLEPSPGFALQTSGFQAQLDWLSGQRQVQSLAVESADLEFRLPGNSPIPLSLSGLQFFLDSQQWQLSGSVSNVPLDPTAWRAWSVGQPAVLAPGVLRAQASWQLQARPDLTGRMEIRGAGGELQDLAELGFETPSWLLQARIDPQSEGRSVLASELTAQTPQLGQLSAQGELFLEQDGWVWRPELQSGLKQQIRFDLPQLDWLGELTGGLWITRGQLQGDITASLQGGQWSLLGSVQGQQLDFIRLDEGIRLTGGQLLARLDGSQVTIETLHFPAHHRVLPRDTAVREYAGSAAAAAGGLWVEGSWGLEALAGQFTVRARHFPVIQRVDRYVSADADLSISVDPRMLTLEGRSQVQFGYVNLGEEAAPTLSDDVVIDLGDGAERPPPLSLRLDVGVDLGEQFLVRGQGLSTTVVGQLQLRSAELGLQAAGELRTRDGSYQAYGQRLTLRRGRIVFSGPIADPVLDIVALRPGARVEAGVQVSGTGRRPQIRLISEPEVPDLEKLSWILLGQGPDEMRTSPNPSFLIGAAMSLLGQEEGLSFTRELGLDELSIRQAGAGSARGLVPSATVAGETLGQQNDLAREFLVLGKRLSDPLYLTLESALNGRESLLRLSYRVSDRLSLAARTGTVFGVDLVWRILLDD